MDREDKPDYSEGFDTCPWCDKKPKVSKHFRYNEYQLIHRCDVLLSVISMDWTELDSLKKRWNQPKK